MHEQDGLTALMLASKGGFLSRGKNHLRVVELLADKGANVEAVTKVSDVGRLR